MRIRQIGKMEKTSRFKRTSNSRNVCIVKRTTQKNKKKRNSRLSAIIDWTKMGLAARFQIGEIGQTNNNRNINKKAIKKTRRNTNTISRRSNFHVQN